MNEENKPSDYPIKDGVIRYKAFEAPKSIELDLVIKHLEKELERQNLLIATNADMKAELELQGMWNWPRGPIPEEVYPNIEQFRDELELAIGYLKTKKEGNTMHQTK